MLTQVQTGKLARIQQTVRDLLGSRHLVVVSNREPYVHRQGEGGLEVERPAGGLVAALDPVLQASGGVWVAWGSGDADFTVTDERGCVRVPPEAPRYTLRRVRLSRDEVERSYHGYANQSLWPLFHLAVDKARFAGRYWTGYQITNRRFAEATLETVSTDALIWLHDYHLALTPRYLRAARPDLFLMHFWHIPWPAWDVFRICPQSADLIEGLLANDLLAFHLPRHVENFLDCASRELGAEVDREEGIVEYGGRYTRVQAHPISIDADAWEGLAASRACQRWMARLRRRFRLGDRFVGVGVDRLDYTKGIPERLRAIELLFQRSPGLRGRFTFLQKSAPSRTRIRAYRELQDRIGAEIRRINVTYGTEDWQPIIHIPTPLAPAGMAALYRMADVCLVTSLQDGMNLVAKEFVACQVDGRGVLVLSELAGAADEAPWSVAVNPYDAERMANALLQALHMPPAERAERMRQMRAHLRHHDIYYWMEQHFRAAAHLMAGRTATRSVFADLLALRESITSRDRLALLVDFDGTLAPLVDRPAQAALPPLTRALLARLARRPQCLVAVISGRALPDLRERVGLKDVIYVGNHGFELAGPGWAAERKEAGEVRVLIAACSRRLRERLRGIRGAIVEDKGLTASVHYRLVDRDRVEAVRQIVLGEIGRAPPGKLVLRRGKMVLEIRPAVDWHKGHAARWLLDHVVGGDWPVRCAVVYAGDDRTDEDAFLALADHAVTIKVGPSPYPTAAKYAIGSVEEFTRLLGTILTWVGPRAPT
ncbi:MAG: bifunctional alpha,alpha-trehalose-phosphate synthase (UDP-forming)/trehalose-phosphatase [Armatimonadota bacterium]|nr:bifunctional alpha,alpha-trehalose-phosphate synthase (UDP-forming)/trehalose-phosphatase [Armatimonadota bacterium]